MPRRSLIAVLTLAPALAVALPLAAPTAGAFAPAAANADLVTYGTHPLQQLDFYRPADGFPGPRPLILFIHGGAWAGGDKSYATGEAKIRHYTEAGYALASVNYRLLPEASIEDQASDIAAAIAALRDKAQGLGIDPGRVVIMGHSAGAHLGALVATDPQWLRGVGMAPADIAGVVLLDGAAYDVPRQIREAGPLLGIAYQLAFGDDAARQERLSPIHHVESGNASRFLILHITRPDSTAQAEALGEALAASGTPASVEEVAGRGLEGHNLLNGMLGREDSPATVVVDAWLREAVAARRAGRPQANPLFPAATKVDIMA